jgi:hypothetical protein
MNSTNGSSATECLPIPMAATAAGITGMPNDGGREQDRRSSARAAADQDMSETHNAALAEYDR